MTATDSCSGPFRLLYELRLHVDAFLSLWSEHMRRAGYLEHTTAKRQDCIVSLDGFLLPILTRVENTPSPPTFTALLRNEGAWADALLASARRHRVRGVTDAMFCGCFLTLVHAVLEIVEKLPGTREEQDAARDLVRLYADAFTVLFIRDGAHQQQQLGTDRLDHANRLLTLEKCKLENILDTTSDLVLVLDGEGVVRSTNRAAQHKLGDDAPIGRPLWEVLGLEAASTADMLRFYPTGQSCEIAPPGTGDIFRMQIAPLRNVSLASDGFMVMLTNVTSHVMQRETLERIVSERTEDLRAEKLHLEEMNITLRTVLRNIDAERDEVNREVARKVHNMLLPALATLGTATDPAVRQGYVAVLRDQLLHLAPGDGNHNPHLLRLTPTELRICQFIQAGKGTKDIATILNLSHETVQTHRKNIRRKLDLRGTDTGLYAYLRNSPPLDSTG